MAVKYLVSSYSFFAWLISERETEGPRTEWKYKEKFFQQQKSETAAEWSSGWGGYIVWSGYHGEAGHAGISSSEFWEELVEGRWINSNHFSYHSGALKLCSVFGIGVKKHVQKTAMSMVLEKNASSLVKT